MIDPTKVRLERTGWRDEEISGRHRFWGFNCPAVDLDFLVVEYNLGKPVALIEYKFRTAGVTLPNFNHATYRALKLLADDRNKPLPFAVVFYRKPEWCFYPVPVNDAAREWFPSSKIYTERDYVTILYKMREREIEKEVLEKLSTALPEVKDKDKAA